MNRKQYRQLILGGKKQYQKEMTIPGEPLIFSIKYDIGKRHHSLQVIRNMQWRSMMKSIFKTHYRITTPVVLLIRFYVSPRTEKISKKKLAKEETPAVDQFELCDYGLSFLEMVRSVLFNCYRQIVKLDMEKYYSDKPRTVFKFMSWDEYIQDINSVNSAGESLSEVGKEGLLQSELQGDVSV